MLDLSSKKAYLSEGFYLQPDDYVMVQPDKYKNFQLKQSGILIGPFFIISTLSSPGVCLEVNYDLHLICFRVIKIQIKY